MHLLIFSHARKVELGQKKIFFSLYSVKYLKGHCSLTVGERDVAHYTIKKRCYTTLHSISILDHHRLLLCSRKKESHRPLLV